MKTEQANKQKSAELARLIERAKTGDQAAYAALYEATREHVYRTARAMVRSDEMAQDVQQEVYVYAFTHLDSLREPEKLQAWLRSIAVKQSYTALRQTTPILFSELGNGEGEELPEQADLSGDTEPELTLERKETARYVNEILDELTDGQRAVVAMYYYEQLPVCEIARDLGVTPGTVKTQLVRSRKKIEASVKRLEEKGVKLYGLSPLPLLIALLKRLKPEEKASKKVLAGALSKAGVTETTMIHASTGFFSTLAGKLLIGVTAAALVGGGAAGMRWYQSRSAEPAVGDVHLMDSISEPDNLDTPEDYIIDTEPTLPEEETDPAVASVEDSPEDMPEVPTDPEPTDPVVADDHVGPTPQPTEPEPSALQPTTPQPTAPEPTEPQPPEPEEPSQETTQVETETEPVIVNKLPEPAGNITIYADVPWSRSFLADGRLKLKKETDIDIDIVSNGYIHLDDYNKEYWIVMYDPSEIKTLPDTQFTVRIYLSPEGEENWMLYATLTLLPRNEP